jgi:hypothetical protein
MRHRIGQRLDELHLLDDRARPAMRDDDRQGLLVLRAHVDEMDVEAVDLGDEVRHRVDARLALAPVVFRGPVARELLRGGELHALRGIGDGFLFGESCRQHALAQVGELRIGDIDLEGRMAVSPPAWLNDCTHGFAPVRGNELKTQGGRGDRCRGGAEETAAIEIRRLWHGELPCNRGCDWLRAPGPQPGRDHIKPGRFDSIGSSC